MNQADTAWMLISTALVLLMTPALAFFYGGLARSKNALNTMMMSFISLGFVGVAWALIGYTLAFSGTQLLDRRPVERLPQRCRPRGEGHHPAHAVHGVPGDVLHHHGGADLGRDHRADALLGLRRLHHDLGDCDLRADRALGLGRRLAGAARRVGLRRRHRRARERGGRGACRRAGDRQAHRLRVLVDPSAQRAVRAARRRPAVVRLVRVQRRQRAGGEPAGGPRLRDDDARAGGDAGRVDAARHDAHGQADRASAAPPRSSSGWWP